MVFIPKPNYYITASKFSSSSGDVSPILFSVHSGLHISSIVPYFHVAPHVLYPEYFFHKPENQKKRNPSCNSWEISSLIFTSSAAESSCKILPICLTTVGIAALCTQHLPSIIQSSHCSHIKTLYLGCKRADP